MSFIPLINQFWTNRVSQSFDVNDSVIHLLKQGLAATYWRFYLSYLFIHEKPKPVKVPAQKHIQLNIV